MKADVYSLDELIHIGQMISSINVGNLRLVTLIELRNEEPEN
jgi:hypothetical protein